VNAVAHRGFIPTAAHVIAARRELARQSFPDFACMVDIPTVPLTEAAEEDKFSVIKLDKLAKHHLLLCSSLQGIEDGTIPNLMLLLPPGSAKSTYADVVFVPWFMSKKPRRNVILGSYASEIAAKQGRRARQLINSKSYHNLTGRALDPTKKAADEWMLDNGSEFMAGGLLSGITGNRAALGILDDPISGREAAESETIRNKTWNAYIDDFCSRLIPGAPQIMIMTRWHADDPAGRILPEDWDGESGVFNGRDGRIWHVICLPAIADRVDDPLGRKIGETLWPEWFSLEHWEPFKRNSRTWSSLYQQKPSPDEGTFFKGEWFNRYTTLPKALNRYITSDHAPKGGVGSDWNVFNVWGVDQNDHIWLIEEFRSQATFDVALGIKHDERGNVTVADEGGLALIKKHKPFAWFPEDDATWKASEPFIRAAMRRTGVQCRIEPLSAAGGDKPTKARALQAKASMGEVHLPAGFIGDEILKEYKQFPAGKHDDRVDAGANMGRALDQAHPAIVRNFVPSSEPRDRYHRPPSPHMEGSAFG
jgi:phage terminase large subunit-like protein